LQERAAPKSHALGVFADPPFGFAIGACQWLGQRHGAKLAIGRRIDLDRQRPPHRSCHVVLFLLTEPLERRDLLSLAYAVR
jgi:hypothetical protein